MKRTSMLILTVGIAATVAMFSAYWRLVLNPVSVPDATHVVALTRVGPRDSLVVPTLSWPRVRAMAEAAHTLADVAAYVNQEVSLGESGRPPRRLRAIRVSSRFFAAIGTPPRAGRGFTDADDLPNGPAVCMVSYEAWQTIFAGRDIVGSTVRLDGVATEVVGILPAHVSAPWADRDVFLPRVFDDAEFTRAAVDAGAVYLEVVARLRPDASVRTAEEELAALSREFARQAPGRSDTRGDIRVQRLSDAVAGPRRAGLSLLMGAVVLVLLIACANASALLVNSLVARQTEFSIRQALGASPGRLMRGVLGEALRLAAGGGVAGTLFAALALGALQAIAGARLPPGTELRIEPLSLAAALAAVLLSALLVGAAPALQVWRAGQPLLGFARGLSETRRTRRLRAGLLTAEVALATLLLIGAGLFVASLDRLRHAPLGFEPAGVAAASVLLPPERYGAAPQQAAFFSSLLDALSRRPGVRQAAIVFGLPFAEDNFASTYVIAGQPIPPPAERARAGLRIVSEGYVELMKIPLIAGRTFARADGASAHRVCIVNASLARRQFGSASPLGKVLLRGRQAEQAFEIVGVVGDVRTNGPRQAPPDEVFLPLRQVPRPAGALVVLTDLDPAAMETVMQAAVADVDPEIALARFGSMEAKLAGELGPDRTLAALTAAFAAVALLLAVVGLYAVVAHGVAARTAEFGIRLALGADGPAILWLTMTAAMRPVLLGLGIGIASALAASRIVAAQLYGIDPSDPFLCAGVPALFLAVSAAAALVPARRASRVDPLVALRAS